MVVGDIHEPSSSLSELFHRIYIYDNLLRLFEGKQSILFVTSSSLSSVNMAGLSVLFLSATDSDSRKRTIYLAMVELLGHCLFGYFPQNSGAIRAYGRLTKYLSTIKTCCSGQTTW